MKKTAKRTLSLFLAILMLLPAIPAFTLPEAQAVNTTYNATAAAEYARKYALNYNREWWFYDKGGDCANFVSQALFAGGMPMTSDWNCYDGQYASHRMSSKYVWIRAHDLRDYLISIGGQLIINPKPSDISIGDAVFYDWNKDGGMNHSAIVTAIENGVPKVSSHTVYQSDSRLNTHWTFGYDSSVVHLVKLYGQICTENNSPDYDYYRLRYGTSRYSYPGGTRLGSINTDWTIRVVETQTVGGINYGKFNYMGTWCWANLNNAELQGHFDRIQVDHIMGNWYLAKAATCTEDGYEQRNCGRCPYYETNKIEKLQHMGLAAATCTQAEVCKYCMITLSPALGHNFGEWYLDTAPTCIQKGVENQMCGRCNIKNSRETDFGNHSFVADVASPTCTSEGASTLTCVHCGYATIDDLGDGWTSWTPVSNDDLKGKYAAIPDSMKQSRTEYRYSDKIYTTSTTSSTLSGWTKYDTQTTYSAWGNWSSWQDSAISSSDVQDVRTRLVNDQPIYETRYNYKTVYNYYRYASVNADSGGIGNHTYNSTCKYYRTYKFDSPITDTDTYNGRTRYKYWHSSSNWVGIYAADPYTTQEVTSSWQELVGYTQKTQYSFRTRYKTITNYFYKWGAFSDWGTTSYTATDNRQVETRTTYRFKVSALGHNFIEQEPIAAKCLEEGYTPFVCSRCGIIKKENVQAALGHDMGDWYTVTQAAAGVEGIERRDCRRTGCDYFELRGHNLTQTVIEPTCTQTGYTLNKCTDDGCEAQYISDETPALGHDVLTQGIVITGPTCTEDGLMHYCCSRCDYYETAAIEKLGHDYQLIAENSKKPICTEDGYDYYECSNASEHNYTLETKATGHNMSGPYDYLKPESCGNDGIIRNECLNEGCDYCEDEYYFLDHDWANPETVPASCTTGEYTTQECNSCHELIVGSIGEALGHNWGEYKRVLDPTCTVSGCDMRECLRCHIEDGIVIEELGHVIETEEIAATCTGQGGTRYYCARENCSYESSDWGDTNPDNHLIGEWYLETPASCTQPGNMRRDCQREGCSYHENQPIHATGHNMQESSLIQPSCTQNGKIVESCTNNGCTFTAETIYEALGHSFKEFVRTKEPTCTIDGADTRSCSRCKIEENRAVSALGHDDSGEYVITTKASCTENGEKTLYCKRESCNAELSKLEIAKREHSMGNWQTITGPSCVLQGSKIRYCLNTQETEEYKPCSYSETDAIAPNGHVEGEAVTENSILPSCTEKGGYDSVVYCTVCKEKLSTQHTQLTAHEHDYNIIAEKCLAPDYGKDGYDYHECSYDATHNYKISIPALIKNIYTASFMIGDEVIARVPFEQGAKTIDEPAFPEKKNYVGKWDEYTIADADFTVFGHYEPLNPDEISELEDEKTAEYANGEAVITLSAKANTKTIRVLSQKTKPVDLVLVLDQSGSMKDPLGKKNSGKTKQQALIESAQSFVEALYENAEQTGAEHRVALVGFAYSDYTSTGDSSTRYLNTGLLATTNGGKVGYETLTKDYSKSYYKNALIPIKGENGTLNHRISSAISSIDASGATSADLGLEMAKDIFSLSEYDGTRERIVIFLTDGTPTNWGEEANRINDVAPDAITIANQIKNAQSAFIYSIGVHADANPDAAFNSAANGIIKGTDGKFKSFDFNRFLHAVSSNYPDAVEMSNLGEGDKAAGFYMGVNDTSNLESIFTNILYTSVYKIETFNKVKLTDTLSDKFTMTLEQEIAMREKLTSELGITNSDISVTRNLDGTTSLSFANIPAVKSIDSEGKQYYKASVSFSVSADEDALVQGTYPTNTENAGIEINGEEIAAFEIPSITIASDRNIIVFTINGTVYRISEGQLGDEITAPITELASWNIPEGSVITDSFAVFEAEAVSENRYTVTWIIGDEKTLESYTLGEIITPPKVSAGEGLSFARWSPAVAYTMPMCNLVYTAVFETAHRHEYKLTSSYGSCTEGITHAYSCECNDSYQEKSEPAEHMLQAIVEKSSSSQGVTSYRAQNITCKVCGESSNETLSFMGKAFTQKRTTAFEFYLYDKDGNRVQPSSPIEIMVRLDDDELDKSFKVYHVTAPYGRDQVSSQKINGYLVFSTEHFSIFVLAQINPENGKILEGFSYALASCTLHGHSYKQSITSPSCTEDGFTTFTCSLCNNNYTDNTVSATKHSFVQDIIPPTCTEKGFTLNSCIHCNYTEKLSFVNASGHLDANSDGYCDSCGVDIQSAAANCKHLCHSSNAFIRFIWKIVRFFIKLFNASKYCSCGTPHY